MGHSVSSSGVTVFFFNRESIVRHLVHRNIGSGRGTWLTIFARTISLDTEINQGDNLLFSFIPVY